MTEDPSVSRKDNDAGGKYCVGGKGTEKSTDESADGSGEETDESVLEEEAETTGGRRGRRGWPEGR